VNGNIKAIEEIIESFAPQYPFVLRHKWLVQSVLALGIGRAYDFLIDFIPPRPGPPPHWVAGLHLYLHAHPLVYYGVPYLFYYAGGYFPALFFYEKLLSLWPSVELQIGPEHSLIEKRRRRWLFSFLVVGVVPLVTSLIYDVMKLLLTD
jgi:hypothetical protein